MLEQCQFLLLHIQINVLEMLESNISELNEKIQRESAFVDMLTLEMHRVIVGQ